MQTAIRQILVLVTHANAFLSDQSLKDFYPQHEVFRFDESVNFVEVEHTGEVWKTHPFASDPFDWLLKLRETGCIGLNAVRLAIDGDSGAGRKTVAFVGGGDRWFIEAVYPTGADYWEARWEIGDQSRSDQKIWRVTYGRLAKKQSRLNDRFISVEALSAELGIALQEAVSFSRRHKLDQFEAAFSAGCAALRSKTDQELNGLAPNNKLPLAASRLLAAAQVSWVFGGMGSWNDLSFEADDQSRYETLSDTLFRLINLSLVAAVNASFPTVIKRRWWKFW